MQDSDYSKNVRKSTIKNKKKNDRSKHLNENICDIYKKAVKKI